MSNKPSSVKRKVDVVELHKEREDLGKMIDNLISSNEKFIETLGRSIYQIYESLKKGIEIDGAIDKTDSLVEKIVEAKEINRELRIMKDSLATSDADMLTIMTATLNEKISSYEN